MTITLFEAVNSQSRTENGAITYATTFNKNVDFFSSIGASRNKDISDQFIAALNEDTELSLRVLQWGRDIRGGAGERNTFKSLFSVLLARRLDLAEKVLVKIPNLGRWDDILVCFGTGLETKALSMISDALLEQKNGLCAKWMPRQGAHANKIRSFLKVSPKEYRKILVSLSKTVEQQMCAQQWNQISYSGVPSIAAARYQRAFSKHDPEGYSQYKTKLISGQEKINASVAYPYDVIRSIRNGDEQIAEQQWKSLPDYMEGSTERILPIVDVSGSMSVGVSGSITALDVAVSLGLYISERSEGVFKDQFITFSAIPQMISLHGTLSEKLAQMESSEWGMNTNLQAVFTLILQSAKKYTVSQDQMPTKLLILSDMEFDECVMASENDQRVDLSAIEMIRHEYSKEGYVLPTIIFWNLNKKSSKNCPVRYDEVGTCLISGFSPAILKSFMSGEQITPLSVMLNTVMTEKYAI